MGGALMPEIDTLGIPAFMLGGFLCAVGVRGNVRNRARAISAPTRDSSFNVLT